MNASNLKGALAMDDTSTITIVVTKKLYQMICRDASIKRRNESGQVVRILEEYYREREREAELFSPRQLREEKEGSVPVFRQSALDPAPPLRSRDWLDPNETL